MSMCTCHSCKQRLNRCISLQRDGVVLALRAGVGPAHVAGCLGDAASLALGYPMQVTLEKMEHEALNLRIRPIDTKCHQMYI